MSNFCKSITLSAGKEYGFEFVRIRAQAQAINAWPLCFANRLPATFDFAKNRPWHPINIFKGALPRVLHNGLCCLWVGMPECLSPICIGMRWCRFFVVRAICIQFLCLILNVSRLYRPVLFLLLRNWKKSCLFRSWLNGCCTNGVEVMS